MFANISIDFGQFLIKIWDAAVVQLQYLGRPKPRIEQLEKATAELRAKAADINSSISQARREGQIPSNQIQLWLSEVEELEGKSASTEQDFERRRCLDGWSWNCFSVNRRVVKRLDDIDKLMTRADATPVATMPPPLAIVQIPISDSTLGMEAYTREILGHIASANAAGIIGVYGMGGVGKTTLLRSINNHRDVAVFDHVIWAVASKECKMERLQMDIAKRLKLHLKDDDSEEDRATMLFDFLKNKDCLLLLDDLWEPLHLAKLGMANAPLGQGEEKRKVVVFTTRNEQVCGGMKAGTHMEINCLEQEQAWELFRRNAGEDAIESDPGINRIARQIAEECAGLPLALVTVGLAMSTKKSWEAWNDALTLMKQSQMPKVMGTNDVNPMFSAFKLSYDSLTDDNMRNRLLSCSMWPEDHSIKNYELIECWMGLGLIDEVGPIHKVCNRGHTYIETLKAACLLEPGNDREKEVKMHDVIRDMALWMASDCGMNKFKWMVNAGIAASQELEEEGWHDTERASLMFMYEDNPSFLNQLSTCSKLSVLMLQHNYQLREIPSLIHAVCTLTYLDLDHTRIRELPKEISMLSHLQHLNLSYTLIEKLPPELGCLIKLKYLFLRCTVFLWDIAKGAISSLSSLRLLDLRGCLVECWDELKGLRGYKTFISIDIGSVKHMNHLCSLPNVSIWRLRVVWWFGSPNRRTLFDDIMWNRNIRQSVEQLSIEDVETDELLLSEGREQANGLECLKYINLSGLNLLEKVTWKGVQPQIIFPNLRELIIKDCCRLRNVNWALQLPSLSILVIASCDAMEELISDDDSYGSTFGLRRMWLYNNHKLERISPRPLYFPHLEEIMVQGCSCLRKLPFENRNSMKRLKVIECDSSWWDKLEWEEMSIKDTLSPLVQKSTISFFEIDDC